MDNQQQDLNSDPNESVPVFAPPEIHIQKYLNSLHVG